MLKVMSVLVVAAVFTMFETAAPVASSGTNGSSTRPSPASATTTRIGINAPSAMAAVAACRALAPSSTPGRYRARPGEQH